MPFENRIEAGRLLGRHLAGYRGQRPPDTGDSAWRGPMGKVVADALDGELDVVPVRKLRAPQNPELAIGSIDEMGTVYLDPHMRDLWTDASLEGEKETQLQTLRQRRERTDGRVRPSMPVGAWSLCSTTASPPARP